MKNCMGNETLYMTQFWRSFFLYVNLKKLTYIYNFPTLTNTCFKRKLKCHSKTVI